MHTVCHETKNMLNSTSDFCFSFLSINEQIEKMHKKEDNSSKMSYNGITTNHELKELLSYEYKYI